VLSHLASHLSLMPRFAPKEQSSKTNQCPGRSLQTKKSLCLSTNPKGRPFRNSSTVTRATKESQQALPPARTAARPTSGFIPKSNASLTRRQLFGKPHFSNTSAKTSASKAQPK
jgi:hypothetical protein